MIMVQTYKGTSDPEAAKLQHKQAFYNLVDLFIFTPLCVCTLLHGKQMRMVFSYKKMYMYGF